ncbi:MAG: hypothetical protein J1F64_02650 [Oscillospiraceae bacterium]|nr:hypothetical protein [Oscillospiraceae bacterium]
MYEKILNIDTEALSKSVINDIAYVYGAFASGADEDYKGFRTMISPWDQNLVRFIDKKAADRIADMNDFVCPYDLLMSNVTGDITKFYDDAEKKFDDILAFFGDKADKVRSQVKNDFEKSKQTTMKKVEDELYSCVMQELSAKDTIEKMQTLLSDREKSINEIIDSE